MNAATVVSLLLVWFAAIASPGPDLLQIIRLGSRSRSDGIWTAVGIMIGNSLWIIASLLGLSALISATPSVLHVLQLLGGGYLVWMGFGAVRSAWRQRGNRRATASIPVVESAGEGAGDTAAGHGHGAASSLRLGIATNLSNPKAVLFFGAVFAQFVRPDMGLGWSAFIAVFLILTGFVWFVGVALVVRGFAAQITGNAALIDVVTGAIFISLGMFMVWQAVAGFGGRIPF
ncbi:LysE family translocator [Corynebacterium pacaense]|uniref:LysE family translocator n=1 Tax=Corynebacterium pacaense TaxID=1816684 RepID=UPI0009BB1CB2|nr:LysE family translocator [Corynebacterium pacaense]